MRHRKQKITLSRTRGERRSLSRKLAISFITHGRVTTTPTRARLVRRLVEPLVTRARRQDLPARRQVIAALGNRDAAAQLMKRAEQYRDRPGGYTRVTRLPAARAGDRATQVVLEFV